METPVNNSQKDVLKDIKANIKKIRDQRQKWIARDPYEEVANDVEGSQRYIRPFIQNLNKLENIIKFKAESDMRRVSPVPIDPERLWRRQSAVFVSHKDRPKTTRGEGNFFD